MSPARGRAADLAGVVLAAGRGTRMRPITDRVPKPLLTVDNVPLLRSALDRMASLTADIAVNAHHLPAQVVDAARSWRPDVQVSLEREALAGTAGALHLLRGWIAGRPVVVTNADVILKGGVQALLAGWDGRRPRLLVVDTGAPANFGTLRYVGMSTLPAAAAAGLGPQPDGLYAAVWKPAFAAGELEFVEFEGAAFDCGTAAEFLAANMFASNGRSVVAPDAVVAGTLERSVVLAGGQVASGEHLIGAVRDGAGHTLFG